MTATNDDILEALNKLVAIQTPKATLPVIPQHHVYHDGVEVEYNETLKTWKPKIKQV